MADKKKIKNILLTCAGGSSPIYLAKKLKNRFHFFLADATDQTAAPHFGLPFQKVPFGNHPDYLKKIGILIKKWKINCIVPGADEELLPIKNFCERNPTVLAVIPSKNFIALCLNKKKLMIALDKLNISHLLPYPKEAAIKYPAIVKPIFGRGSREVHIINSSGQLRGYLKLYNKKFNNVLIQPYVGGEEYTVSVIVNNFNKIIGIVPKKIILKKGITKAAVAERISLIDVVCKRIVDKLQPEGPFNVQLKVHNGKVYIFEINPRLSTTAVLTDKAFGNEVELYLKYYSKNFLKNLPRKITKTYLYRYEENIFV